MSDTNMEISVFLGVRKGAWTEEEDELLKKCIEEHGVGKWHQVPSRAGLNRCRKSCRLRWFNYLRPDIKRGNLMPDEVDLIIRLHKLLGNRWSLIAGRLPGRTSNHIKNYWNTHHQKNNSSQREETDKAKMEKSLKTQIFRPQPHNLSTNLPSVVKNLKGDNSVHSRNTSSNPSIMRSLGAGDHENSCWENMLLDFEINNESKLTFAFDNAIENPIKDHWVGEEGETSRFENGDISFEEALMGSWNDVFNKNVGIWDLYNDQIFSW